MSKRLFSLTLIIFWISALVHGQNAGVIEGTVTKANLSNASQVVLIELYEITNHGQWTVLQRDTLAEESDFRFENIPDGLYAVAASPLSGIEYRQTFAGETDQWRLADSISVSSNETQVSINLLPNDSPVSQNCQNTNAMIFCEADLDCRTRIFPMRVKRRTKAAGTNQFDEVGYTLLNPGDQQTLPFGCLTEGEYQIVIEVPGLESNQLEFVIEPGIDLNTFRIDIIITETGLSLSIEKILNTDLSEEELRIYPNPTDRYIYLSHRPNSEIKIFDLYGQEQPFKENDRFINIEHLNPGVFFLQYQDQAIKFVVQ